MCQNINVGISDMNVAKKPDVLVTYALGSCVGICLYDKINSIGGLAHIMLPYHPAQPNPAENYMRYADTGIALMLKEMKKKGAPAPHITAKIAGGAQMFNARSNAFNIGERNVEAVKSVLSALRIRIEAEDTGSNFGRTVYFYVETGEVHVKTALKRIVVL